VSVEETAHCRANGCAEMRAFVLGQCDNKILLGKSEPPVSCICSPVYVYVHTQASGEERDEEGSLASAACTYAEIRLPASARVPTDGQAASSPALSVSAALTQPRPALPATRDEARTYVSADQESTLGS
jgi:hypothetical protein